MARVLIACEESQTVLTAFLAQGHDVYSCDVLDTSGPYPELHIKADVLTILNDGWDLMIAHPPCTHLAVSGARWFKDKKEEQQEALDFVRKLLDAPVPHIALENPVSVISSMIRKPDQIVQPWMFGDPFTKTTCLWLKDLPLLQPTKIVDKGERTITKGGKSLPTWYNLPPSEDRAKIRSKTFPGFAQAMAAQWGALLHDS